MYLLIYTDTDGVDHYSDLVHADLHTCIWQELYKSVKDNLAEEYNLCLECHKEGKYIVESYRYHGYVLCASCAKDPENIVKEITHEDDFRNFVCETFEKEKRFIMPDEGYYLHPLKLVDESLTKACR